MLDDEYSAEAQQDVAEHFQVSDRTIRTLLVNHRRLSATNSTRILASRVTQHAAP